MAEKVLKILLYSIVIFLIIISVLFVLFLGILGIFSDSFDYDSSKEKSTNFLNENIDELNELANYYLTNHNLESKEFKIVSSIRYSKTNGIDGKDMENVRFDIDSQGMLGGQYYGLLYIPENNYLGEEDLYIYDENAVKGNGNNIFIRKKIRDNWFFYYDDFDGNVDVKNIK